ncbi:MAG: hypothetical protein LBU64_00155 [Planctomycetota bacterium]|jgi:hypothetical protein|nr:hypothetical protein [Planctomycetota bacterium]
MWAELLEIGMLLAFGAAWPASILKSWRSRTSRGKSLAFLLIVQAGYVCGVAAKFLAPRPSFVIAFYFLNMLAVGIDTALYFRNRLLDASPRPESGAGIRLRPAKGAPE